jgi:hypothetical protein
MSRYIYFTNLKHLIFWNGGSRCIDLYTFGLHMSYRKPVDKLSVSVICSWKIFFPSTMIPDCQKLLRVVIRTRVATVAWIAPASQTAVVGNLSITTDCHEVASDSFWPFNLKYVHILISSIDWKSVTGQFKIFFL